MAETAATAAPIVLVVGVAWLAREVLEAQEPRPAAAESTTTELRRFRTHK
jgi:hypothetical protein